MSKRLCGRVIEFDKYRRFVIEFPEPDTLNTRKQIESYDAHHQDGWSPVRRSTFVAKCCTRAFAYDDGVRVALEKCVQRTVDIEADFLQFSGDSSKGWYILVRSVRIKN